MANFVAYPVEKVREAAIQYGVDPDFAEAVYAAESSRGMDRNAMRARTVKRKRDSTIVRGPFQLEDGTTSDLIRKHKMGNVDVNDPEVHLDLALKLMQDLQKRYDGDHNKMAQAYLGGPGSVGTQNRDELGTSVGDYSNKIIAEMSKLRGTGAVPDSMVAGNLTEQQIIDMLSPSTERIMSDIPPTPFNVGADAGLYIGGDGGMSDPFGIGNIADFFPREQRATEDVMGVPVAMGASSEPMAETPDYERRAWIERLFDEEIGSRDFSFA